MAFPSETAQKIEALFREHLERNFRGINLKFAPIVAEPAFDQFGDDTFHVYIVYDGDRSLLDFNKINSITSAMVDRYEAMGIMPTVLESYVCKEEWDRRDELLAPEPWEYLEPWEYGKLEDC